MEEGEDAEQRVRLFHFLSEVLGLSIEELSQRRTKRHAASPTVEEWKSNLAAHSGSFISPAPLLCKNLFLKDTKKDSIWLVVAQVDTDVRLSNLSKHLSLRTLRFAKEELLTSLLGVKQGSVTPFALFHDREQKRVNVIIDKTLLNESFDGTQCTLLVHPLSNEYTTEITVAEFKRFLEACGHPYKVLDFSTL